MTAVEEQEITIEIICTSLPGKQWEDNGVLYLGIQNDKGIQGPEPADLKRIVFHPVLRARPMPGGAANFLGPFVHGPRTGRFIYLNWLIMRDHRFVQQLGRVKLHLSHISWADVERALARKKPIKVTVGLTNEKGKPRFASVGPDLARWEL